MVCDDDQSMHALWQQHVSTEVMAQWYRKPMRPGTWMRVRLLRQQVHLESTATRYQQWSGMTTPSIGRYKEKENNNVLSTCLVMLW